MSTAGKLWGGFGLLLAVLIGTGLFVAHRLVSIERALFTIMAVQEPATAVTYEMAVNVLTTRSAVIGYAATGDSADRARVARNHAEFDLMKARYDRVALSPASRQLGRQIGQTHASFRALGDSLIGLADRLHVAIGTFGLASQGLEGLIAGELGDASDPRGRDRQRKLAAAASLAADAAGIGSAVGRYLHAPAQVHRVRVADLEQRFRGALAEYRELRLEDEERAHARRAASRFDDVSAAARDVMALSDATRGATARFEQLGREVEQLVGEGTRSLARIDLIEAQRSARLAIRTSLIAVLVLLVAGIVIGGSTALPAARSIVRADQELRERMAELALAHRRKDEFLGVLSHELRNPLAPLGNALGVLEAHDAQLPESVRQTHAMMKRQVRSITRLVDDLLDVNRIHYGKIALRRQPVQLARLVLDVVEDLRPALEGHRQALEVVRPPEPLWVDADPTRLAQIAANLLNNASKYTPDGGRITVTVGRRDGVATLRVADTGIGIAPDMRARIFEPFAQLDRGAGPRGGLGIGLTLVKRLVELHGGTVVAHSEGAGRGSTFEVTLPTCAAPLPAPAPAPAAPADGAAPRRVLVVDDNHDAANTLANLLGLWGHETRVAYDGGAALAEAATFQPDLVLLDIDLPGLDGYEVVRLMRAGGVPAHTRIAALTGFGLRQDVARAYEAGFDHHVTKPVSPETLRALVSGAATGVAPPEGAAPADPGA